MFSAAVERRERRRYPCGGASSLARETLRHDGVVHHSQQHRRLLTCRLGLPDGRVPRFVHPCHSVHAEAAANATLLVLNSFQLFNYHSIMGVINGLIYLKNFGKKRPDGRVVSVADWQAWGLGFDSSRSQIFFLEESSLEQYIGLSF